VKYLICFSVNDIIHVDRGESFGRLEDGPSRSHSSGAHGERNLVRRNHLTRRERKTYESQTYSVF
jgi:hypothetical protein